MIQYPIGKHFRSIAVAINNKNQKKSVDTTPKRLGNTFLNHSQKILGDKQVHLRVANPYIC